MTGRRLAWALWPLLVIYIGAVTWRAWRELTADYTVRGLFRTYLPPQTLASGWLFDARPGSLTDEFTTRYAISVTPADGSITAWEAALRDQGLAVTRSIGLEAPRLIFVEGGPWLITGEAERRIIAFDPARGMLLLHDGYLDPATPSLAFVPPG